MLVGCARTDAPPRRAERETAAAVAAVPRTPAADSLAILDSVASITRAIDYDSLRFDRKQTPIATGAGTSGVLHAWRVGRIWQRLQVEADGDAFHTRDTYWFSNGALLGVQLELTRPGKKPALDRVWFRNGALYRWTDADGRHLNPDARSTQYEVRMMRARLDSVLRGLDRDELVRNPNR